MAVERVLGLDVGSATISWVLLSPDREILDSGYQFHHGRIFPSIEQILSSCGPEKSLTITWNLNWLEGRKHPGIPDSVAIIRGVRHFLPGNTAILHIGAEQFGLYLFRQNGDYHRYISNSGCAAGTGSFLDQQAERLHLKNSARLAELAADHTSELPNIATRCAVFAKTDLIHAQQKGFSLSAICAGLCRGVARNILDNIQRGIRLPEQIIISGGVAHNAKVIEYLQELGGISIRVVPMPEKVAALGLALTGLEKKRGASVSEFRALLKSAQKKQKSYFYKPLKKIPYRISSVECQRKYTSNDVEIEIYQQPINDKSWNAYLGIDIGSTSTKAVLLSENETVLVGLYTRTKGQPIFAVQRLLEALREIRSQYGITIQYLGVGTTGSGRKFIQKIIGADLAVDEITAHARAAVFLRPEVDTIIEIGGQDSKFTVLRNGRVVFSIMNFVCAAGTGSFLEEQASRLGVSLEEYSELAEKVSAPMSSDRCTVFMERDLNYLLSLGYNAHELLAAALHSVRDNYLSKVARIDKIGKCITFQGATARNAALVKAFEQKLKKPIYVSSYCHLTGALGVALILKENGFSAASSFQEDLADKSVSQIEKTCSDCTNHCKIIQVGLGDEVISWGFLCGKDDFSQKKLHRSFKQHNWVKNHDKILMTGQVEWLDNRLIEERTGKEEFVLLPGLQELSDSVKQAKLLVERIRASKAPVREKESVPEPIVGIPRTLYFSDFFPLWRMFFRDLGCRVKTVVSTPETLEEGKRIAGAEFCSPMANFHGVVQKLLEECEFVFLPTIFANRIEGHEKSYCYYSNYAVSLVLNNPHLSDTKRIIHPLLQLDELLSGKTESLYDAFPQKFKRRFSPEQVRNAFRHAYETFQRNQQLLRTSYEQFRLRVEKFGIVLLGRPYLVLDELFNLKIAERIAEQKIPVIYQDQLPLDVHDEVNDSDLFSHWFFGEQILKATRFVLEQPQLFPIYLTAFKCSPDSFLITYFRDLLDRYDKPYLILQLDEHNSQEGYDTRIEAALEAFGNYHSKQYPRRKQSRTSFKSEFEDKTYLLPNYEPLAIELMAAAFRRHGVNALPVKETPETIQSALRLNDGQCLPISALVQGIAYSIEYYGLKPEKTAFFINAISELSCNLPQYPMLIKNLLEKMNNGLEKVDIFLATTTMLELPFQLVVDIYCSYLLGGLIQKMACRIRPYELREGETDRIVEDGTRQLALAIENRKSREKVFRDLVHRLLDVPRRSRNHPLPRVGIIGDLYVRDNHVFNQNLIHFLERQGAEVITTPYNFLVRLTAAKHFSELKIKKQYLPFILEKSLLTALKYFDEKYMMLARPILDENFHRFSPAFLKRLTEFHLSVYHPGETSQNLMKIFYLLHHYPDIRLLIHVNPVFCCPGLISEALFQKVEEEVGVPIVSITYDGTQTQHNRVLLPYLHFLKRDLQEHTLEM